jgi:hypothetical protein
LFIDKTIYDYKIADELSICAYWVGAYQESFDLCEALLKNPALPQEYIERIQANLQFAADQLKKAPV